MSTTRLTKILLALACCLAIVLIPVAASAQEGVINKGAEGVKKGAEGVKKGAETAGEATKEGAESVGHGVKKAVTGEDKDTSRMKGSETTPSTEPSQTTTPSSEAKKSTTRTESTTTTEKKESEESRKLPGTAGELPLLALAGALALAAAGAVRVIRREN